MTENNKHEIVTAFPNTTDVIYDNKLNKIPVGFLSESEQNLFFAILSQVKDTHDDKTKLSFNQIKALSSYKKTSNKELANTLRRMTTKLQRLQITMENEERVLLFVLFPTFDINIKKQVLEVRVNQDFQYIVNDLKKELSTEFSIEEFTSIKSKYAKTAFRLARQHENSTFDLSVEMFKDLFATPKSYTPSEINRSVVPKIIEIMSDYFTPFKLTPIKENVKNAHPVVGYHFEIGSQIEQQQLGQLSLL